MAGSTGYNSRAYVSNAPGAFYVIYTSDFGEPIPGAPTLTVRTASGTITSTTSNVRLTWITAEGVSLPSTSTGILVNSADGGVSIVQPTVPTNGAPVIGWQIYSQGSTGAPKLNTAGIVPAPVTIKTNQGNVTGFAVNTTTVFQNSFGTGALVPVIDNSGIQSALPSVTANSTSDYYAVVPNTSSQWKVQKSVNFMRSDGTTETAGIVLSHLDCIAPEYPGTGASVTAGPTSYFVMNGYLFEATTGGTTASTFIGFSAFNTVKGGTTVDNTVTWTCLGKAALIRFLFGNVSGSTAIPVAQTYELFAE